MNKAIDSFLKFVPDDKWICQSSGLPWLELNISVPGDQILSEADKLYSQAVSHRSDDTLLGGDYSHHGWKSLCIYGDSPTVTHHTVATKNWTEIADKCPKTVEFLKQHWEITESTGRIRFMWLDPGGYILPHNDRSSKGFFETNVAITNPDRCQFRFLDYGRVPFHHGSAFLVDICNRHFVVNNSAQVRTHLIVHAKLNPGIIKSSYAHSFYN